MAKMMKRGKKEERKEMKGMSPAMKDMEERMGYRKGGKVNKTKGK